MPITLSLFRVSVVAGTVAEFVSVPYGDGTPRNPRLLSTLSYIRLGTISGVGRDQFGWGKLHEDVQCPANRSSSFPITS
jgi:hypothetical protein